MTKRITEGAAATEHAQITVSPAVEPTSHTVPDAPKLIIVVAGDVCIDVLGLERSPAQVSGEMANWKLAGQTITEYHRGGAWLPAEMIRQAVPFAEVRQQVIAKKPWGGKGPVQDEDLARLTPGDVVHSFLEVAEFPQVRPKGKEDKPPKVYRIKEFHGFAGPLEDRPPNSSLKIANDAPQADIVACDDAGNGFRNRSSEWPAAIRGEGTQSLIVYKLGRPLPLSGSTHAKSNNELWEMIRARHRSRTIVIIDANDLRLANVHISRRLSWERTAKELVWQLLGNPALAELRDCQHLIVCFGNEAAVYYRNGLTDASNESSVPPEVTLLYDPARAEDGLLDDHPGRMSGYRAAFTAALTATIAGELDAFRTDFACVGINLPGANSREKKREKQALTDARQRMVGAIKFGMCASRQLHTIGLGSADGKSPNAISMAIPTGGLFPATVEQLLEIANVPVPLCDSIEAVDPQRWCILLEGGRRGSALETIARGVVVNRSADALKSVPQGKFGDLVTYDRTEIEGYRAIRNLVDEFLKQAAPKRPLCLAVFGPPGSGKSFGVEEVAKSVSGGSVKVDKLEFNVSQFGDADELSASLQLVRDRVLGGEVPLVFFDEFDASLGDQPYGWLKYFLAPMQDGRFLDRGALHPIGKAIFVFAGGTRPSFQEFCPPPPADPTIETAAGSAAAQQAYEQFRAAKGPDFVSRLRGYINVLGPNPRDGSDHAYVIRRALLLRSLLKRKAKHLFDGRDRAQFDDGVLRAMLKVSRFHHGARSMEAVLDMSMLANRKRFEAAALPSADQLELHVPSEEFYQLVNADRPFGAARELFAQAIHEKYRAEQSGNKTPEHPSMQPWETLREDLRASNLAQADDIPDKLKVLGLALEAVDTPQYKLAKENHKVFDDAIKEGGTPVVEKSVSNKLNLLAEMEHERWVAEKLRAGWRFARQRDDLKKLHTDIVAWEDLPDGSKTYDRDAIRAIPDVLAAAGYRVFHVEEV